METRYAKKDVYAEVQEEGGKINRLVATAGEPVPVAYAGYVQDSDTTTVPPAPADLVTAGRATAARRQGTAVNDAEGTVDHEEARRLAAAGASVEPAPAGDPSAEPLDGYGELGVDEVLERLDDLDPDQVAAVQAHEAQHRGSKKIAAYEPAPAG